MENHQLLEALIHWQELATAQMQSIGDILETYRVTIAQLIADVTELKEEIKQLKGE